VHGAHQYTWMVSVTVRLAILESVATRMI
jgi:hypothetical protein